MSLFQAHWKATYLGNWHLDLFIVVIGGIALFPVPGSLVGPGLLRCLIRPPDCVSG